MSGVNEDSTEPKKGLIWIQDVFAAEFGNSDVQANYSRLYAWMANQLGHMMLGLATALAFYWIYETMHDLASWTGGGLFSGLGAFWLHTAGFLMLCGTGGLVAYTRFQTAFIEDDWDHRNRIYPLPPKIGLLVGVVLAVALVALYVLIQSADPGVTDPSLLNIFALAAASLAIVAAIVILAKDWRALALGTLFMAGAFWLIASEEPLLSELKDAVAIGLFAVLAAVLLATARHYDSRHDKVRSVPALLSAAMLVMFSGVLFVFLDRAAGHLDGLAAEWAGVAEPEWRIAFGAAIAALALWLVKEFGSDIPLVSVEVARATKVREAQGHETYKAIERGYFMDAVWDARTDGAFYVTGAVIAIGLLTDTGTMLTTWASGPDFLGVVFFGLIFLISGRRWAFRQQALDLVGSPYASRLAVFENAIELRVLHGEQLGPPRDHPLSVLLEFARGGAWRVGVEEDPASSVNFDHLVILGKLGSGKTPLGIAISSEAALRDLEARIGLPFYDPVRPRKSVYTQTEVIGEPYDEAGRRDARYITLKNLYTLVRYLKSAPRAKATAVLRKDWGKRNPAGVRPAIGGIDVPAKWPGPADVLVVDDVNLALPGAPDLAIDDIDVVTARELEAQEAETMRHGQDVRMLEEILPALPQDRDQHTVWMIDVSKLPEFVGADDEDVHKKMHPVPENLRPLLGTLSKGLRRTDDEIPPRIAVAFVEMKEKHDVQALR
ncbi:MAG: hypothetical protein AAGD13_05875 [Pseudomonadota bacterium]